MAFQMPITIAHVLSQMEKHDYVLPAIQREFVWSATQICDLFDSLMRGYPIGSFLFWKVEGERIRDYVYYDFIRNYHQIDARRCPKLDLARGNDVTAILDGQQRLTALNIGLRGSYAAKLPRLWWNNPNAFPVKNLYLDLCSRPSDDTMRYRFRFLTQKEATPEEASTEATPEEATLQEASAEAPGKRVWFLVKDIRDLKDGPEMLDYLCKHGYAAPRTAYHTLDRLHKVVNVDKPINYYLEDGQDLDKVLTIFIRTNHSGTPLSYSDMLLSIAVAQWRTRDAREEIHSLVDRLNRVGQGFGFSKDLVLKSGLAMTNANDIRFRVTNFNTANMVALEDQWGDVSRALLRATQLLAGFGLSRHTLRATNVIIPVAYYLAHRGHDDSFLTASSYRTDRMNLRFWVMRSLAKAGVWGSADTLLKALCEALRDDTSHGFPTSKIESEMARLGKSLRFEDEEIKDLAENDRNVFPLLALMYRDINLSGECHVDHIFPKRRFTIHQLRKAGVSDDHIDQFIERRDRLPNLQLLEGPANLEKSDTMPRQWLRQRFPGNKDARQDYMTYRDMQDLPECITKFLDFYEARRKRIERRLRRLLGTDS